VRRSVGSTGLRAWSRPAGDGSEEAPGADEALPLRAPGRRAPGADEAPPRRLRAPGAGLRRGARRAPSADSDEAPAGLRAPGAGCRRGAPRGLRAPDSDEAPRTGTRPPARRERILTRSTFCWFMQQKAERVGGGGAKFRSGRPVIACGNEGRTRRPWAGAGAGPGAAQPPSSPSPGPTEQPQTGRPTQWPEGPPRRISRATAS
jgi:hypothetical protein